MAATKTHLRLSGRAVRRVAALLILLSTLGCVANPQAASTPPAAAQPALRAAAENPACPSIFKLEYRAGMMVNLFDFYENYEGRPYLWIIIDNWVLIRPNIGYCESGWEFGDLNADGRVDYEDFGIYATRKP
jgi:hypothetical protein